MMYCPKFFPYWRAILDRGAQDVQIIEFNTQSFQCLIHLSLSNHHHYIFFIFFFSLLHFPQLQPLAFILLFPLYHAPCHFLSLRQLFLSLAHKLIILYSPISERSDILRVIVDKTFQINIRGYVDHVHSKCGFFLAIQPENLGSRRYIRLHRLPGHNLQLM